MNKASDVNMCFELSHSDYIVLINALLFGREEGRRDAEYLLRTKRITTDDITRVIQQVSELAYEQNGNVVKNPTRVTEQGGDLTKQILDACCGTKCFHFDKDNPLVEFMDNRVEPLQRLSSGRMFEVSPTTVADFRAMPFKDSSFNMVIFDPPHRSDLGTTGWIGKRYSNLPKDRTEALALLREGFAECWRVLAPGGTLVFKWCDRQLKLADLRKAKVFPALPVMGSRMHAMGGRDHTFFLVLYKER